MTTAWDSAHSVISVMGDRFVLVRFDSRENRRTAGRQALRNLDHEGRMRQELSAAVGKLIGDIDPDALAVLDDDEMETILDLADVVTLARTAVERDFTGNVVQGHAPEMPTRFAKQLAQIARGGIAMGMSRAEALAVATRCAADTMPPLRLTVLLDVARHPMSRTADVVKRPVGRVEGGAGRVGERWLPVGVMLRAGICKIEVTGCDGAAEGDSAAAWVRCAGSSAVAVGHRRLRAGPG